MNYKALNIYLSDLKNETRKAVLNLYNVKDGDELNLDVFPIFTLEVFDDKEEND